MDTVTGKISSTPFCYFAIKAAHSSLLLLQILLQKVQNVEDILIVRSTVKLTTRCLKKYPFLTGNRNEMIRYYYSELTAKFINLQHSHTLHLKIVNQKPEIQAHKVKIYSAPEFRGFEKGPSHDSYCGYFPEHYKL